MKCEFGELLLSKRAASFFIFYSKIVQNFSRPLSLQKRGNAVILEYVNYRPTDFPGGALFWKEKYENAAKS